MKNPYYKASEEADIAKLREVFERAISDFSQLKYIMIRTVRKPVVSLKPKKKIHHYRGYKSAYPLRRALCGAQVDRFNRGASTHKGNYDFCAKCDRLNGTPEFVNTTPYSEKKLNLKIP